MPSYININLKFQKVMLALFLFVAATSNHIFAIEVNTYFNDNMVIQREKSVKIWGTGKQGEKVAVSFDSQNKITHVDKYGNWIVTLDPTQANATGQKLMINADSGKVVFSNVLIGDVWFFGRQTYVDITLGRNAEGESAATNYKAQNKFRTMVINTIPAKQTQNNINKKATTGWVNVDSENSLKMSASAFYLGNDLVRELGVPIGIVDINMDRYFGLGWLSEKALTDSAKMFPKDKEISWLPDWMREKAEERDSGKAQKDLDAYYAGRMKGKGIKPSLGLHPLKNPMYPSAGYNAVIHPLRHVVMKGILLQLGNDYPFIAYRDLDSNGTSTQKAELDSAWGSNYMILKNGYRVTPKTLPFVVADWRRTFSEKQLPIGLILPPSSDLDVYAAHNREVRELHRRTSEKEAAVGLIMPGNKNIPSSGQPADDKLLAKRCEQWILGSVNKIEGVTATGPLLDRVETKISKATIYFKEETVKGLKAIGNALDFFETAGPDRIFTKAKAEIDGSTIKLVSNGPVQFVRYNWTYKPNSGLVNQAGLPALPFSTDVDWVFSWIPPPETPNLPIEYSTTADKWEKSDIAIINGMIASMATGDSEPIPRRPGPIGIYSSPFGPNIYVINTDPDTPAVGKLLPGDLIYGANGETFKSGPDVESDEQYRSLSRAITYSETNEAGGKLVLSVRRGTQLMEIVLQLKVLGSYSSTTPYYCEKSENIVKNAEAWSSKKYRPNSGLATSPVGMLNTDLLFLLASGNPEHQGLVRRAIYNMISKMTPQKVEAGMTSKPWTTGYASLVIGEYFHSTGDRNVLPYLKYQADLSAESQIKPKSETPANKEAAFSDMQVGGWRQNYPGNSERWKSGYGLMPHAGMPCVMGMQLAKEAGLDIDDIALNRGLKHFHDGRAEYGYVLYSYGSLQRKGPAPMNPEAERAGKLWSMNGKLGTAAALYDLVDNKGAVDSCARYCTYGYNKTRSGHGGMFFNNFWTPIGAWAGGENSFKHFMKNQIWWRELFRKHDGSFNQVGRGKIGVSYALHYVAPKKRLRILGAPKSAFGTHCPEYLKPSLEAHKNRDYALCEDLITKYMENNIIIADDIPVVNHFLESVRTLRASIDHDLTLVEKNLKEGKYYYASIEMSQLRGIVSQSNMRLKEIVSKLESAEGKEKLNIHRKVCETKSREISDAKKQSKASRKAEKWHSLVAQKGKGGQRNSDDWQMRVVEHTSHAPADWAQSDFDDSTWNKATLPISWTMYHTALFRSKFNIDEPKTIEALRVQGNFFQQANVVIYLNGEVVGKVDNLARGGGTTDVKLTDYSMKLLKKGENTIAISSRHKRRWGPYRGTYKTAATVGFWVEALKKK